MIYEQVSFIDEYLMNCVILGGWLLFSLGIMDTTLLPQNKLSRLHRFLFYTLCFYLVFQSVRGVYLTDIRKLRWVIYFLSIALSAWMISRKSYALPQGVDLVRVVTKSLFAYFILYLFYGFTAEILFGMSWSAGQNILWGGSSYAIFPSLIAIPFSFILAKYGEQQDRMIAWATLFLVVIAGFYFDSRACYFVILACLGIVALKLDLKRLIVMGVFFFAVLLFFTQFVWPEYQNFESFWSTSIASSSNLLWSQEVSDLRPGDIGRFAHLHLLPKIVAKHPDVLLFGTGYRASGWLIGPGLAEVFMEMGKFGAAKSNAGYESTVGIISIALETGLVGLFLLMANVLCTLVYVLRKCKEIQTKLFLGLILTASFFWLFVTNPTDMPIYFLLIMPHGFLYAFVDGKNTAQEMKGVELQNS